jgi:hypothetical protein
MGDGGDNCDTAGFQFRPYKFPVRGAHTYGDGVGAPRAGHVHEGQDVLAPCGTPLQAARGGHVQYQGSQSAAGNYIVIDGKGTGHDYVYMHLKKPSPLKEGDKVKTGEKLGVVGETGDATACHLHYEEWSAPGWYQGGHYMKAVTQTPQEVGLELIGASRRGSGTQHATHRLRLASAVAVWTVGAGVLASAAALAGSGRTRSTCAASRGARASSRRPPTPSCASQGAV